MKSPIRVGIIGLGGYAGAHHECILSLEARHEARLVCTCDPQAKTLSAQQNAWEFGRRGVKVFADYKSMIEVCGDELDLLVIPTPITLHAEMHRAGVDRGIAVYLEKPPTLDHRELEEMIATDRNAKKATLVGFNFIIEPARLALKRRLLAGEFGLLREARLLAQWPRPASYFSRNNWAGRLLSSEGRVVLDSCFGNAMAHFVHNILFWAGASELMTWGQPKTVQAELYRAHEIEGADTFFVETKTGDGVVLRFALTHACTGDHINIETLVCEKAVIRYSAGDHAEVRWNDGRIESVALDRFNAISENHLAYYRYLRGETVRPATTLEDSRPFVVLNNLAYVSSGEITRLPSADVKSAISETDDGHRLVVAGLGDAFADFLDHGRWPGVSRRWRAGAPAKIVGCASLNDFMSTLQKLKSSGV